MVFFLTSKQSILVPEKMFLKLFQSLSECVFLVSVALNANELVPIAYKYKSVPQHGGEVIVAICGLQGLSPWLLVVGVISMVTGSGVISMVKDW